MLLFPFCLGTFYVAGFTITLTTQVGFDEGWDRKLIKPLIVVGVFIFGILPSLAAGVFAFIISKQVVYAFLATGMGMTLVAAVMLHVSLDIVSRLEFKEI
jgi:hypothetical protein